MSRRSARWRGFSLWASFLALLLCLSGCERKDDDKKKLVVFAASSLQRALESWTVEYEREHPDVDVQLTFSGSQVLRLQVEQGAKAGVFVSADAEHLDALLKRGLLIQPKTLAFSDLVVITPKRDRRIAEFADLVGAERIVLGTLTVPIGKYSREVVAAVDRESPGFARAVERNVVSYESNVRLVRAKVEMGEADAAFVYRTEATNDDVLRVVEIPERFNVSARYRLGSTPREGDRELAETFVRSLLSEKGQKHLSAFGFRPGDEP